VVDITLNVSHLGTTSVTYEIDVMSGERPVANGRMVAVFIDRATGEKRPWPDSVRDSLGG
jgi:acyl-CoA thioesterase FadM